MPTDKIVPIEGSVLCPEHGVPSSYYRNGEIHHHCLRCHHDWQSAVLQPKRCPTDRGCSSPLWNRVRRQRFYGNATHTASGKKRRSPLPTRSEDVG